MIRTHDFECECGCHEINPPRRMTANDWPDSIGDFTCAEDWYNFEKDQNGTNEKTPPNPEPR